MDIAGCASFALVLRVPDSDALLDPDGAEVRHDFATDGASADVIAARISAYAAWLSGQPDAAFAGDGGANNKDRHLKVVVYMVDSEYEGQGNEVWGFLTLPALLLAECGRRGLPVRVVLNALY